MQLPSRATSRRRRRCRISKSTQAEYADVAPRPAEVGYDCATRIEKKMQEGGKGDEGARDPGLKGTGTPGPSWRFCTTKNKGMEIGVPGSHDAVEQRYLCAYVSLSGFKAHESAGQAETNYRTPCLPRVQPSCDACPAEDRHAQTVWLRPMRKCAR